MFISSFINIREFVHFLLFKFFKSWNKVWNMLVQTQQNHSPSQNLSDVSSGLCRRAREGSVEPSWFCSGWEWDGFLSHLSLWPVHGVPVFHLLTSGWTPTSCYHGHVGRSRKWMVGLILCKSNNQYLTCGSLNHFTLVKWFSSDQSDELTTSQSWTRTCSVLLHWGSDSKVVGSSLNALSFLRSLNVWDRALLLGS